jgi:hypothetical protein
MPSINKHLARRAVRINEWQEISIASENPADDESTKRPCNSSNGDHAME